MDKYKEYLKQFIGEGHRIIPYKGGAFYIKELVRAMQLYLFATGDTPSYKVGHYRFMERHGLCANLNQGCSSVACSRKPFELYVEDRLTKGGTIEVDEGDLIYPITIPNEKLIEDLEAVENLPYMGEYWLDRLKEDQTLKPCGRSIYRVLPKYSGNMGKARIQFLQDYIESLLEAYHDYEVSNE